MLIREARPTDADHLTRFINMAADDLPLHFWKRSVGSEGDPWAYGRDRAACDTGNFSWRNAWLAEAEGKVAACLLGYAADPDRYGPRPRARCRCRCCKAPARDPCPAPGLRSRRRRTG